MSDAMDNEEEGVIRSRSEEIPSFTSSAEKPLKQRVLSVDHRHYGSIRPSLDSRIVGPEDKGDDQPMQQPIVKLSRIPSSTALEPHEMALISSSIPEVSTTTSFDDIETPLDTSEEVITPPKALNREMRNLQQSANSSKVLSNFLTNTDTPRRRKNKEQSNPPADVDDSEMEAGTIETNSFASLDLELMDREVPLKQSPMSDHESDSTIVLQDEGTQKQRRKSFSRPRSRSRNGPGRKKSMAKMMSDELAVQSDKEENDENLEETDDLFVQPRTFDNRAPNPPPKPGWDSFCFKCHADNAVLSLACSRCKCSYHRACVRPNPIPKNADEFVCPECQEMQAAEESEVNKFGHERISEITIKEMLVTILETIRTQTGRDYFENDIPFKNNKEQNPLIVTQMSYKLIEKRITNCFYKTTEAFLHDMRQLEHNWMLVDKSKAKALKPVMKYIYGDINEMESCVHCYSSAFVVGNWFSAACLRPHLLVWAKLKGYPYWPAKVMSVDLEKQLADVRFFGAHDRANIPFNHCLIYSEKDPNKGGKGVTLTNTKKGYVEALAETKEYIKNVTPEYGFEYSVNREYLDPENYQAQLERQLPKWKNKRTQQASADKEAVVPQKEKLTLKLIRTSDVTKSAEKTSKVQNHQDRHPLYRVLSNADPSESEKSPKPPSRRTTVDSEKSARSGKRTNKRVHSDNSESNMSTTESVKSASSKKNRDLSKKRKLQKTNGEEETEQRRSRPSAPPTPSDNVEEQLLEEIPTPKPAKRVRNRSRSVHPNDESMPLIVSAKKPIPPGTDEIHTLREGPGGAPRAKNRSRSLNRATSQEREAGKKKPRRSSAHPSSRSSEAETTEALRKEVSILRRRLSQSSTTSNSRGRPPSRQKSIDAPSIHEFPAIEIKSEPTSDIEEVVEASQVTLNDIQDIVGGDNSRKRKTILISTSDNSNDGSLQSSRARKTFPNSISVPSRSESRESAQARSQNNPMVCIPQTFSNNVNGHTTSLSAPVSRRNSQMSVSAEVPQNLPRLVPKPRGVFTADGTNFHLETGAVSAVFSENAHRMTDYFKQLLIDTIGAASSGIPSAQISLLKLENEKLQTILHKTKADCTLQLERQKQEHMDEIRVLRAAYEDKLKKFEENAKQDKLTACAEIRRMCEIEKQKALDALKKDYKGKTWCSLCMKEARFYCCWNTSYCGTSCQREHWPQHQSQCRNTNTNNSSNTVTVARESPIKKTIAPTISIAPSVPAASLMANAVSSTAILQNQNATVVIPMIRKSQQPANTPVQSINAPITTSNVEIRPQTQQIIVPTNSNTSALINHLTNTLFTGGARLNLQNLNLASSINPPALVPTNQPKKVIQPKPQQPQKVIHKIIPNVTTSMQQQQQQPISFVVSTADGPPVNIISTSTAMNNVAAAISTTLTN